MASVNKAIIVGRLGKDPEMRVTAGGDQICNITVATSEKYKDKQGIQQENTEWHRVSAFGKLAEIMGKYLAKGSEVYIEGSIHTRKYTDKAGVERYSTDIRANTLQMLGGKGEPKQASAPQEQKDPFAQFDKIDEDIPF